MQQMTVCALERSERFVHQEQRRIDRDARAIDTRCFIPPES